MSVPDKGTKEDITLKREVKSNDWIIAWEKNSEEWDWGKCRNCRNVENVEIFLKSKRILLNER